MQTYSIGEVSALLDLSISTLRYYDKEGILEDVDRTEGGIRVFKDADIRQLNMVECLKGTGMSLKEIKQFFEWCKLGDSTIENRYQMFLKRRAKVEQQMAHLQDTLNMINFKCAYYKKAKELGTTQDPALLQLQSEAVQQSQYIRDILGDTQ